MYDTVRAQFSGFLLKLQSRVVVEEYLELVKDHANHVLMQGLEELEKRRIMI